MRLLIGILCVVLGLVLVAAGHRIRNRTPEELAAMDKAYEVRWLSAKARFVRTYPVAGTHRTRWGVEEYHGEVAEWTFVTEEGKKIDVRTRLEGVTKDALDRRDETTFIIKYSADDPAWTSAPLPEGIDVFGNKISADIKPATADVKVDTHKDDAAGPTAIGLVFLFVGGAMVYASFKA